MLASSSCGRLGCPPTKPISPKGNSPKCQPSWGVRRWKTRTYSYLGCSGELKRLWESLPPPPPAQCWFPPFVVLVRFTPFLPSSPFSACFRSFRSLPDHSSLPQAHFRSLRRPLSSRLAHVCPFPPKWVLFRRPAKMAQKWPKNPPACSRSPFSGHLWFPGAVLSRPKFKAAQIRVRRSLSRPAGRRSAIPCPSSLDISPYPTPPIIFPRAVASAPPYL